MKCPHCKTNINQVKVLNDYNGLYMICPGCREPIRLYQKLPTIRDRDRPHMSKKERLRQRWAGREAVRFAKKGESPLAPGMREIQELEAGENP